MKGKKGMITLGDAPGVAIALVMVAVMFVVGFLVIEGLQGDLTANSTADNATDNVVEGMSNITDYADTWGTIIGVAVLLGIVIAGLGFAKSRGYF